MSEKFYSRLNPYCPDTKIYTVTTSTQISQWLVDITNSFINKPEEVFNGIGLRSKMRDGIIVEALEEILQIQLKNIQKIELFILNIVNRADEIANNFEATDKHISNFMVSKGATPYVEINNIPESYEAYLEEYEIFNDVKYVIVAYDQQIDEEVESLAKEATDSYIPILDKITIAQSIGKSFKENIFNLKDNIDAIIQEAIYSYIDLEEIICMQK